MESSTTPNFDPYAILPFSAYRSAECPEGECCYSLMHFIESEKFRGVDESYRVFLLGQADPDDFLLETGVIHPSLVRGDWADVRFALIRAGMWMQLVQHQDALRDALLQPGCSTGISLLDEVAADIYQRLTAAQETGGELRRVVIAGDLSIDNESVFETFDHLFQIRQPDEVCVSTEAGVAELVHRYAQSRYIPVRTFDIAAGVQSCASALLDKGTHVFTVSKSETSDSALANQLLAMATAQGKVAHRFAADA